MLRSYYLEAHLYSEDEFVFLKETPGCVDIDRVGDTVNQVDDAGLHFLRRLSTVDSLLKHNTECLQSKLQRNSFIYGQFFLVLLRNIWAASWQNQQIDMCIQRRLRSAWASAQSNQSSLCAQWVAKDPSFLHTDSKYSDQTGRMSRLIWVFAGRTLICWFCHEVAHNVVGIY